jgi:hypothetical protein
MILEAHKKMVCNPAFIKASQELVEKCDKAINMIEKIIREKIEKETKPNENSKIADK